MKRNLLLSIFFLFLFALPAKAQIENEINAYVDTTEVMIRNGRKLFIKKLKEKDDSKAGEIYQYLESLGSVNVLAAFDYNENLFASVVLGNWETTIVYMKEFRQRAQKSVYPSTDQLLMTLQERLIWENDSLLLALNSAVVDDESKRIIELFLYAAKAGAADEHYNQMLKQYHRDYRHPAYTDFLNNYLPRVKAKLGYGVSLGPAMIFPTESLAENFSSSSAFGMSLDFNINKVFSSFYMMGGGLPLKIPFSATSTTDSLSFTKKEKFHYLEIGAKAGYFIVRNNRFHLAPYVSLAYTSLESKRFDDTKDDDREFMVINSFSYGPGIHSEIKLSESKRRHINSYREDTYWSIKLDAGYNMIGKFDETHFMGNTFNVSLAIVMGTGTF
ncbi:MAG TPA: autotransporter outer membrane beta-barrel domain-containing protein [Prolixibacteraceae bacterium]|nr:autotransporter outer membrane beta-barrel domain-containing protein [Prolixibacteraceae bacterium]